ARPAREVLANRRLQVVDVVQEYLLDFAGPGVDVARHGDIDDEQRPVTAPAHDAFDVRTGQDRRGRTGRGDDDVAGAERGVEVVPVCGARAADRLRRARGVGHRPADARHVLDALRLHVTRR